MLWFLLVTRFWKIMSCLSRGKESRRDHFYKTRIWHIRFRAILPFFLKSLWHVQIAKIPFRIHENFLLHLETSSYYCVVLGSSKEDFLKALWLEYCAFIVFIIFLYNIIPSPFSFLKINPWIPYDDESFRNSSCFLGCRQCLRSYACWQSKHSTCRKSFW